MKVLYVSKAMVVAAYRDKLSALGRHVDLTAVVPERWAGRPFEPADDGASPPTALPVVFGGHNHLHLYRGAAKLLDELRPDLVHIDEEPYSAVTYQLASMARRRGTPSLYFAWQNLPKRLPPPFGALRRRVFGLVAGGIAGTDEAAAVLREAGYSGPLAIIPQMGVDLRRFRPDANARERVRRRMGVADGHPVIGFGGRLVPEKGVDTLLRAASALPRASVLILGDGSDRGRLERLAAELGLAPRLHWAGEVPSCDMPEWLAGLDVLALPSVRTAGWVEQFGRILVEAMACGIPVVGSDAGEIPRVIGDAGLVVPPGDVGELTAALRRIIASDELRAELGDRGHRRAAERFGQDRIAAATAEFYVRVTSAGAGGGS